MAQDRDSIVALVRLIDLAHKLGIQVVAEGVEHEAKLEQLIALGCEKAQGYRFSPALPASDIGRRLSSFRSPAHLIGIKGKRARKDDEPRRRAVG